MSPCIVSVRKCASALPAFWFIPELPFIDDPGAGRDIVLEFEFCACAAVMPSVSAAATPIASIGFLFMVAPRVGGEAPLRARPAKPTAGTLTRSGSRQGAGTVSPPATAP